MNCINLIKNHRLFFSVLLLFLKNKCPFGLNHSFLSYLSTLAIVYPDLFFFFYISITYANTNNMMKTCHSTSQQTLMKHLPAKSTRVHSYKKEGGSDYVFSGDAGAPG